MDGKLFNLSNLFSESLKLITHCPVCKVRYNPALAKVVEERSEYNLVHLKCQSCQKAILAVVVAGSYGVNSVGVVTDLSSTDVARVHHSEPLNADDVLALHEQLVENPTSITNI